MGYFLRRINHSYEIYPSIFVEYPSVWKYIRLYSNISVCSCRISVSVEIYPSERQYIAQQYIRLSANISHNNISACTTIYSNPSPRTPSLASKNQLIIKYIFPNIIYVKVQKGA